MALTDFTIIRRSMFSRLFSTVTTTITVAVAVGLMLLLLSMRDSGRQAFERGSGNMHLLVSADSNALTAVLNGIFYANPPQRPITWEKFQQLQRSLPPTEYAVPTQLGDSYRDLPVLATTQEFFTKFKPDPVEPWALAEGRIFEKAFEIVAGSAAAKSAGLKIGDRIHLAHGMKQASLFASAPKKPEPADEDDHDHDHEHAYDHDHHDFEYTLVGILKPTGSAHDRALFTDLDSTWIIHAHDRREREDSHVSKTTAEDLKDEDRLITGIYLRLLGREGSDAPAALAQAFDMLRRDTSIVVAQPTQQIQGLFRIVSNIDQVFIGMAAVVMVSSGIAVMLALYNSMEQRRRQIAVLRVLGCSQDRVFGLVITESAMIGLMGAVAGLLLCLAGGQVVASIMKDSLGLVIHPSLDPRWTLVVMLATVALAGLAGMVPAVMAYRTPVVQNLKPIG